MNEFALTTIDNPYNPFTQFDDWYSFDEQKGYHTCSLLARVTKTSFELSETTINDDIDDAINEICKLNVLGIYTKIGPNDLPTPKKRQGGGSAD